MRHDRRTRKPEPTVDPALLGCLYRIPDPMDTAEQADEYYHRDLAELDIEEVRRHRTRLVVRLAVESQPDPWLVNRLQMLNRRLARER